MEEEFYGDYGCGKLFQFINARSEHTCELCGESIMAGERYIKYVERSTGWEKNACMKHFDEKRQKERNEKRLEYEKK